MRRTRAALALTWLLLACGADERVSAEDPNPLIARADAAMQRHRETRSGSELRAAVADYRRALAIDPDSADALVGIARTDAVVHAFESSIVWAERALAIDPTEVRAHGVIGDAALELGDLDRAERHYQAMIDRKPGLSAYARGARLLDRRGQHVEAAALMQLAIGAGGTSNEHLAWCHLMQAQMLWRAGEVSTARAALATAASLSPDHPDLARTRMLVGAASASSPSHGNVH